MLKKTSESWDSPCGLYIVSCSLYSFIFHIRLQLTWSWPGHGVGKVCFDSTYAKEASFTRLWSMSKSTVNTAKPCSVYWFKSLSAGVGALQMVSSEWVLCSYTNTKVTSVGNELMLGFEISHVLAKESCGWWFWGVVTIRGWEDILPM